MTRVLDIHKPTVTEKLTSVVREKELSLPIRSATKPTVIFPMALHPLLTAIRFAPSLSLYPSVRAYEAMKKTGCNMQRSGMPPPAPVR